MFEQSITRCCCRRYFEVIIILSDVSKLCDFIDTFRGRVNKLNVTLYDRLL